MTPNNFRVKSGLTVGTTISGGNTTISGFANVIGGVSLSNSSSNFINWSTAGVQGPSINTRSPGTKLLLYPALSVSQTDYAIGISPATIWSTVPSADDSFKFKWYGADIEVASLSGAGNMVVSGYINAASHTVGTSFVANTSRVAIGTAVGLQANGGIGTAGQVLHSNGTTVYWATDDQGVTSIVAANGLSGGTITTTGQLDVVGGAGLISNSTGVHVGSANGISVAADAVGVTTGSTLTVNATGIHVNSALSIASLALSGDITVSGNLTVSGTRTYVNTTTLDVGDNIITLNADLGATAPTQDAGIEIMRGTSANVQFIWDETNDRWSTNSQPLAVSSLIAAGAASGITTLAAGNTTITGFANVDGNITSRNLLLQGDNTNAYIRPSNSPSNLYLGANGTNYLTVFSNGNFNVGSTLTVAGVSTFNSTVTLGSVGLSSNGSLGTAGQVLHSNGTATYWSTDDQGVTSVVAANGLNGGTITSTGTMSVLGGSTLTVNTTGVHVNSTLSITSLALAGALSGVTTAAVGNTTITGFANVSSTIRAGDNITINSGSPSLVFTSTTSGRTSTFGMTDAYNMYLNPPNGGILFIGATSYTANVSMANNNITNPILTGYTEHEVANAAVTGTFTMDCGAANFFDLTLTGNTTISPSNVPPSTRVWSGSIAAKQDATGGRTITWPTGTKYAGGVAPPATTTANALDIWSLMTYDGGTSWIVSLSVKGVA